MESLNQNMGNVNCLKNQNGIGSDMGEMNITESMSLSNDTLQNIDINAEAEKYSLPPEFLQEMLTMNKKCVRFSTWAHAVASIQRSLDCDFLKALEEVKNTPGYGRAWTIYFEDGSSVVHMKRYGYKPPEYRGPVAQIPATDLQV